jgi:uncharacterized membrane protein
LIDDCENPGSLNRAGKLCRIGHRLLKITINHIEGYRVKTIIASFATLIILSLPVQAGGDPETEEELAARSVWHAAKLRGVAFRAIGQEPGWLLEMTTGEKILLLTEYGQTRTVYPYVEPEVFQAQRKSVFNVNQGDVIVTIEGISCADSMSGEKFEASVTIDLNDKQLKGCGRALY